MLRGDQVRGVSWEEMLARPRARRFQRSNSFSAGDDLGAMDTAADIILQAGYDLEEHTVTTSDGYIMQMQRIPRHSTPAQSTPPPQPHTHTQISLISKFLSLPSPPCAFPFRPSLPVLVSFLFLTIERRNPSSLPSTTHKLTTFLSTQFVPPGLIDIGLGFRASGASPG